MKTYTTKIAKNGATLYYSTETGKRIAKETALENERKYILANGTTKERYALAQEDFYLTTSGEIMKNGFYTAVSRGTSKGFKLATKYDWHIISDTDADIDLKRFYNLTVDEFRAEAETERVIDAAIEGEKAAANAENPFAMTATEVLEDRRAEQVAKDDEKTYTYTTNRGNVYTAYYGETGSIPRSRWYYYHEVGGLSEQVIIEISKEDGGEFVNMLCKFIATETDGSEDDADEPNVFNLLPALDSLRDVEEADETYTAQTGWENPHDFSVDGDLDTDRYLAVRYHFTNDVETEAVINNAGHDEEDNVFSLLPSLEETDEDDDTDEPEILNADMWVNLYNSPYSERYSYATIKVGDNMLYFRRQKLIGVTSGEFTLSLDGQREVWKHRGNVVSVKKVVEFYANKEKAAEQEKIFRAFLIKDYTSNSYLVKTTATFVDGVDHNYAAGFAKFTEAQAFVEEVKEFVGDVPTFIAIIGEQKIYYYRKQDGTEVYECDPDELKLIDEYAVSKAALNIAVEAEEKAAAANVEASTEKTMAAVTANVERHNMTPAQFDEFIAELKKQAETTANIEAEEVAEAAIEDSAQMAEQVAPILKHEVDIIKSHGEGTFTFSHAEETDGKLALYFNFEPSCFIITGKEATLVEVYTDGKLIALEEIIGDSRWTREVINGEELTYYNGAFNFLSSDKYDAWLAIHGQLPILRIRGINARFAIGDDEFFGLMAERGACTLDPEEPEPPVDNFTAELAARKATYETAQANADKATEAVIAARRALHEAEEAEQKAKDVENHARAEYERLGERKAGELRDKLITDDVINATIGNWSLSQLWIGFWGGKFTVSDNWQELAQYDTPEQVSAVIDGLKAAIERGDKRFTFPPAEDVKIATALLDKAKLTDSLERALKIAVTRANIFASNGQITAAETERAIAQICRDACREVA